MEAGAVVGQGGEVGLGSAAADPVVGCGPGWGEPGSGTESDDWMKGEGLMFGRGRGKYLTEPKRR